MYVCRFSRRSGCPSICLFTYLQTANNRPSPRNNPAKLVLRTSGPLLGCFYLFAWLSIASRTLASAGFPLTAGDEDSEQERRGAFVPEA